MRSKNEELMKKILVYVDEFFEENLSTPSTRVIASRFNISGNTVYRYLQEMSERGLISYVDGVIETLMIRKYRERNTLAPLAGAVSCGTPLLEEENIEEFVSLPTQIVGRGQFYFLQANGNSMIGAGICDDDYVLIRKQDEASEGDIVVALLEDGTTTLKRFFLDKENKRIWLHPENPEEPEIYTKYCKIQGVAVQVMKSLKASVSIDM